MLSSITNDIIHGNPLSREDALHILLEADTEALCSGAEAIRHHFCGTKMNLCSIINGKSGRCSEDCKYCAQSAHNHTEIDSYSFLSTEEILKSCIENEIEGVHRFAVVTAGRTLSDPDMEKAVEVYRTLRDKCRIELCASHGLLKKEQFQALKAAGVSRYHANIETSERNFPNVCTTHTFQEKLDCIRFAQEAGLEICSGGIIGMGETYEDRIDMALTLRQLGVNSIPINVLIPMKGTPFEHQTPLSEDEILRSFAIFRYLNPKAEIRFAGGRILLEQSGKSAFQAGANAAITGNMLTTSGNNIKQDFKMLSELGFDLGKKVTANKKSESSNKMSIHTISLIGVMTAVTCILGPLSLPIGPVPISFTNLAIYLTIILLGTKRGTISYLVYLLIGFIGLPVFSNFTGGPGKLLGPTGGYLIGFIFMALITGFFVEKYKGKIPFYIVGMVIGTIVTYGFGTIWLAYQAKISFAAALFAGVVPFIIGDLAKIIIAVIIGPIIKKRLLKAGFVQ